MILQNYDFEIQHCMGKLNPADALSRFPAANNIRRNTIEINLMDLIDYNMVKNYIQNFEYPQRANHEIRKKEKIKDIYKEGHEGTGNTWKSVLERYASEELYQIVRKTVQEFRTCQLFTRHRIKRSGLNPILGTTLKKHQLPKVITFTYLLSDSFKTNMNNETQSVAYSWFYGTPDIKVLSLSSRFESAL
ncbi:hypothetical protein BB560_006051 [Smittium megazygosporum]|uniref:Integrase zinc-binding domain-containing protein n=1 Tax=Smittium megazygosporum TaxID=133381 RepID=A0A2T9YJK1_9FUNG|nr:hypothetical protein BB560_006051 [Smittium megazygosporum]